MFLMIGIGILVGMLVRNILPANTPSILISLVKLALLPITMGVGYEILMIAGKHDNVITRIISAPGLWVQRITTKEPTLDMLEVAIVSTKCALRDEFPEFMEYYESKGWEPEKAEPEEAAEAETAELEAAEATETEIVKTEAEATTASHFGGGVDTVDGEDTHSTGTVTTEESAEA